jgi:hypothetical protein
MGRSYYHRQQAMGPNFVPGVISGYFNDLSEKVNWGGFSDGNGIPLVELLDGRKIYFPTTIIQKGLGHWDSYLTTGDAEHLDRFLVVCSWLVNSQDAMGGWVTNEAMGLDAGFNYSAMPQGEAISALIRAWKVTGEGSYVEAAKAAFDLMIQPVQDGGTTYYEQDFVFLEEFPSVSKNTVLNGWIFALFGVYDYCLATNNMAAKKVFDSSVKTLIHHLHKYDSKFWSYYDEEKAIASPFYHNLHVAQLRALYLVTKEYNFKLFSDKFKTYEKSKAYKTLAVITKASQKLRSPGKSVVKC